MELYIALQALQLLWLVGLTVSTWLRKPGLDAATAATKMREDLAQALRSSRQEIDRELLNHALKLREIDTQMKHMPSSEELALLEGTVKQIAERTAGMVNDLEGVRAGVSRIETYLLNNRG